MAELPKPVRAYIGLWARAVTEARDLPRRVVELPVLAASSTARATLRVGQQYADLVNLGDGVLSKLHGTSEEPPSWATFDDDDTDDDRDDGRDDGRDDELGGDTDGDGIDAAAGVDEPAAARPTSRRRAPRANGRALSAFDLVEDDPDADSP